MDTTDLWAVHIVGPDDVIPCASMQLAFRNSLWLNIGSSRITMDENPRCGHITYVLAVPERWDGTAEEHASALAEENTKDPRWSQPGTKVLADIALDVLGPGTPLDEAAAAQAGGTS